MFTGWLFTTRSMQMEAFTAVERKDCYSTRYEQIDGRGEWSQKIRDWDL